MTLYYLYMQSSSAQCSPVQSRVQSQPSSVQCNQVQYQPSSVQGNPVQSQPSSVQCSLSLAQSSNLVQTSCELPPSAIVDHRVGRVLSFFSSHRNWDSPNPSPAVSVPTPPPPTGSGVRDTLAGERGGGRVPIPTRGHTMWYSTYTCTLGS